MAPGRARATGLTTGPPVGDGFLFSGNRHETVPRSLFLDRRLTPLERNAWQVVRLQLQDDGITAFPNYEQLSLYLASMPCVAKASSETVARALTVLRLTRWLSLVQRRRDKRTGRIQGNLYVLHDEPLSPFEAIQLDCDYLNLVSHALTHASKAVQRVGYHALRELAEDPLLGGCMLPTRLQVISQRLAQQGWISDQHTNASMESTVTYPQHASEDGGDRLLRIPAVPPSESEDGCETAPDDPLPNPKTDRTVRKETSNKVRTVPRAREELRLPSRFLALPAEQQSGALTALQQVDATLRQAVLDEWEARCAASTVRNPAGYLFGIIGKALRGEFRAWRAVKREPQVSSPPSPPPKTRPPTDPEVAMAHLAHLRTMLGIPPETSE
ncbi:STY4528 family pathogenicity island replication protein [Burkholderia pseudomallei]|uniref:STY4528 family pathogenicity island replication protein n=1 Tax=Burkholderia pseudomallei TaxID=28450 RepID=UPI0021F75728|nr:STY4528 family pathogenicity island replication protein [Burkholderia pseudomallei]MCW0111789.1 STY4528 family pathogenicity island replication protein [Burkholderia pseudomallei]